uniref:Uncharacterized protein n=1 Tax=Amphimedon queenslandica TaxID=400682 RepID=A0A1X7U2K5_AMPQE
MNLWNCLIHLNSSCSVSSGQYYVSDDCSSVTQSPCNPLSVYAGNMSQYNNTIFYFIGTSVINFTATIDSVQNITLHGLDQSPTIHCISNEIIPVTTSSHVSFSNISIHCNITFRYSSDITIAGYISKNQHQILRLINVFDSKITSSVFDKVPLIIEYNPPLRMDLSLSLTHIHSNRNISCSIRNNDEYGLSINGHLSTSAHISVIDTELVGNKKNEIRGCPSILLNNVTVKNSLSTGLVIIASVLTVENRLVFKNNTGVVGGGMAINGSSVLVLSPSANLKFIDNRATYKGGGIYIDERTACELARVSPIPIPLTLKNNTAGVAGNDIYGQVNFPELFSFTNISTSSDPAAFTFCDPDSNETTPIWYDDEQQSVFPGQPLKYNVALFGRSSDSNSYSLTDGRIAIEINGTLVIDKYINNCSLIEYTPKYINYGRNNVTLSLIVTTNTLYNFKVQFGIRFILNECPIGFRVNSSGVCDCSVSRENVTCDINTLDITHNGLLWIGTYHTSTPFNANETNPNACIINQDCLLYCSPNPVTFQFNHTDTQCVDNRGHRMCGSCTEGYSLLMGSNKCGRCHNNYMMIAWIALFAVMGVLLVVLLIALNLTVSVGTLNGLLFYANIVKLYEPVFSRKGALPVLSQVISWINLDFGFEICFYNGMDSYAKQWLQFAFPLYLWIIIIIIIQLCKRYGKISRLMGSHAVPVLSTLFLLSYTKLVRTIVIVLHKREVTLHCTNESVKSVSLWYEDPNVEYAKGKHAGLFGFAILRYGKISRLMGSHAVPVLSTLFLLSYTKLVRTIVIVLHKREVTLHCTNESVKSVSLWYEDPNVEYAKGKHAGLFGFAILVSVFFVIPYTLFLLLNPFYEKYLSNFKVFKKFWSHFKPIIDAYSGPMKDEYRFWPGLLLVARIPVLLSVTLVDSFIQSQHFLLSMLLTVLVIVLSLSNGFCGVYKKRLNNLSHMKCYDALIKKLFKKQDEDDDPLLDVTESHLTVDQQRKAMVPSSTDVRRCASRESVVDFSSCSVSSGQYYVSDNCSSVTQSSCNPLSVYAGNMSQYNNTIFYFIGTSVINFDVTMDSLSHMKCYDALIKKLFKKQDEDDDPLLDM